ncbi:MAG: C1 family peptidase [Gammaproteobacteria bacterium]
MSIVILRDLRSTFGPARNQGSRPTCVAFAVSDAHGAARRPNIALSPEHLYWHSIQRTPDGHPDDGVALPTALDALLFDGQCAEAGWPYQDPLSGSLATWAPPPKAKPVYRRGSQALSVAAAVIIDQLDAGMPAVVTLLLGERYYRPVDGVIELGPGDSDTDYHAVVAVGHGRDGPDRYILVRNSWGEEWGFEGHAWVHVDYLEPRLYRVALISEKETI